MFYITDLTGFHESIVLSYETEVLNAHDFFSCTLEALQMSPSSPLPCHFPMIVLPFCLKETGSCVPHPRRHSINSSARYAHGRFSRTKVITWVPRIAVVNATDDTLEISIKVAASGAADSVVGGKVRVPFPSVVYISRTPFLLAAFAHGLLAVSTS